MLLTQLLEGFDGEIIYRGKEMERDVTALYDDSRACREGGMFFCISGENSDGHEYVLQAVRNGAVAVVVEKCVDVAVPQILVQNTRRALALLASKFFGESCKALKIIGLTGTNGKTTTAHMLAAILRKAGKKVGIIGTLGVRYANVSQESILTTPDPIALHSTFSDMQRAGIEYVVMECSAHALHLEKLSGILFSACIFTNLTHDHLDFFRDMRTYQNTKLTLFAPERCPIAIVNTDDATGREIYCFRERERKNTTLAYGLSSPSDSFAIVTNESLECTDVVFNLNDELACATLWLPGTHNVYNALAAVVCAKSLGLTLRQAVYGLSSLKEVDGRMQCVAKYKEAYVFTDYAHTPDGLEYALRTLKDKTDGKLICLFGCGGNRDREKRCEMGEVAAKLADYAVLTSDNPRYEDPMDILSAIERGFRRFSQRYVIVPVRERAIEYALERLDKGDVLLIAGKGGEKYQEIMGIKYAYDDKDIIKKWIEGQRA